MSKISHGGRRTIYEIGAVAPTTGAAGDCGTKLVLFNRFSVDKMLAPPASERSES
jgi:hypothetical protein